MCSRWIGAPGTNAAQPERFYSVTPAHSYLLECAQLEFPGTIIGSNMGWSQSCDSPPSLFCSHEPLKVSFFPILRTAGISYSWTICWKAVNEVLSWRQNSFLLSLLSKSTPLIGALSLPFPEGLGLSDHINTWVTTGASSRSTGPKKQNSPVTGFR